MTDVQFRVLAGIPLVGILANAVLVLHLRTKMNARFERIGERFDMLMGKVIEIDNRLIRVEDRMGIKHWGSPA